MLDESDALVAFGNLQNKIYAAQYAEANGIDAGEVFHGIVPFGF